MKKVYLYFRKYPYVLVMASVALVWMTINIIEANRAERALEKYGKYTIATIQRIKGAKSGRWVIVKFEFNGRKYTTETRNESIPLSWVGEKIFIKFLPSRPYDFDLYESIDVPDSLANLTPTIWDSLPIK